MESDSNPQPADAASAAEAPAHDPTEVRYLTPEMCRIHLGSHGALHATVLNDRIYGGVYAAYAFPVAHSDEFISLIHSGGDGDEKEIGIIRDLKAFPEDQAALVRAALQRRYFIHRVQRIHQIGWKYGFVRLDVETDKGHIDFLMRWKTDRAVDYGRRGKVLIDVSENRYLIPDLAALTPKEQQDFRRIIYW
ncbi:MAG TPA: DUF1854 domain-containing protein [Phycisphaerae bacterium]|nr:DUF1854 domain-containing protein [Phycisphaerae bacterium]